MRKNLSKIFSKSNLFLYLIVGLGTLMWSLTMARSGLCWNTNCAGGFGFWGANGHDGVWHLALINSLSKWDFNMPVFAGHALQNYHIGFDLMVAFLRLETGISVINLYFQILPPFFALLIGFLTYKFVLGWTKSVRSSLWAVFFVYFGAGLGWLVTLARGSSLAGESMFWSQQAISTLINPPFALSLVFILLGLICLQKKKVLLAILFLGVLIEIKVYAAILVLIGLFLSKNFKVFLGTLFLSLVLFWPFLKSSSALLVWQPFWFLETMMGLSDRFGWARFYSAMTTYRMGGVWVKAIAAYGIAFAVFLLGNQGTRIIFLKDIFKKPDSLKIFALSVIAAGVIIPMFFLQKGTSWNTIQFFYYSLFFSGILAGIAVSKFNIYHLAFIIVLTLPGTIGALRNYLPAKPPAILSALELSGLSFLREQPDGTVLTYPFDAFKAKEAEANPPRPLYLYDSTAYVSAFGGKTTFLEDEVNLNITGYDWSTRRVDIENWYKEKDQEKARAFLKENNIKYIYWLKRDKRFLYATEQRALIGDKQLGLSKLFENKEVVIYMVKSEI